MRCTHLPPLTSPNEKSDRLARPVSPLARRDPFGDQDYGSRVIASAPSPCEPAKPRPFTQSVLSLQKVAGRTVGSMGPGAVAAALRFPLFAFDTRILGSLTLKNRTRVGGASGLA